MTYKSVPAYRLVRGANTLNNIPAEACQYTEGKNRGKLHDKLFYAIMRNAENSNDAVRLFNKGQEKIRESFYKKVNGEPQFMQADGKPDFSRPIYRDGVTKEDLDRALEENEQKPIDVEVYAIPARWIFEASIPPGAASMFSYCINWSERGEEKSTGDAPEDEIVGAKG